MDKQSESISLEQYVQTSASGWDTYLPQSPDHLEELKEVAGSVDQGSLEAAMEQCMGSLAKSRPPRVPIALFYGPPGTGKTYAMQVIAAEAELTPYILRLRGTEIWESEFQEALRKISKLDNSIVFLDECETVFSSREALAGYGSVMAETKKACIGAFLQWVNGLESQPSQRLLFCMATNKLENLDEGIKSRSRVIKFRLPNSDQRQLWWSRHARILPPGDHAKLAIACVGLSFRDLWAIAEQMVVRLARKLKQNGVKDKATLALAEYLEQVSTFRQALRHEYNVGDYLRQLDLSGLPELTWEEYCAEEELKAQLKAISNLTDQSHHEAIRIQAYGSNVQPSGPPIVLLHGPPGTGKTQGMKVVAAQSKKHLYILSLKGLVAHSQIRDLFSAILEELASLQDAIVFLDECEEFFQSRSSFQGYASVEVQHQKHIVTTFIQWADGLEKREFGPHGLVLCLATNMKDALDPAISDRARKHIEFQLPNKAQRLDWWIRHSRHLRSSEHKHLARVSGGLSFRGLWAAAEKAIEVRMKSSQEPPSLLDYKACVTSLLTQPQKTPIEIAKDLMWGARNLFNWLNEFAWARQNVQFLRSRL